MGLETISIMQSTNVEASVQARQPVFEAALEGVRMRGSGYAIAGIRELQMHVAKFRPLSGSSYIPLPKHIDNNKAIINICNVNANEWLQMDIALMETYS